MDVYVAFVRMSKVFPLKKDSIKRAEQPQTINLRYNPVAFTCGYNASSIIDK